MPRAVQFDEFGGLDVLTVREVELKELGKEDVRVDVRAAGINPGEAAIRAGKLDEGDSKFPSGEGSDLAGVVDEVGIDVTASRPATRCSAGAGSARATPSYASSLPNS